MYASATSLRVAARYPVPPDSVFEAWIEPRRVREWLFATATRPLAAVALEPHVGGRFRLVEPAARPVTWFGTYTDLRERSLLAFRLRRHDWPAPSHVVVDLRERDDGCELVLVHDALPADERDALANRWSGALYGLGTLLDAVTDPVTL